MRLKEFTLSERIKTFSTQQKDKMNVVNDKVKNICDIFDTIIELENYIIKNILVELDKLISLRSKRTEIEFDKGNQYYISQFKDTAQSLDDKIANLMNKWNVLNTGENKSINKINQQITLLKDVATNLSAVPNAEKLISITTLIDIVNEFGNFQVYKAINSKDLATKINILIELKEYIESSVPVKKKISIDDL